MTSTQNAEANIVTAAMSVARDAAEGRLSSAQLDAALADELREAFGDVVGDGDSLWQLQLDVARRVIALGGISADELSEWAAALRYDDDDDEPSSEPDAHDDPSELRSTGSVELSAQSDALDAIADAVIDAETTAEVDDAVVSDVETQTEAESGCGCASSSPTAMVALADGRRVPSHRIVGRGPSVV